MKNFWCNTFHLFKLISNLHTNIINKYSYMLPIMGTPIVFSTVSMIDTVSVVGVVGTVALVAMITLFDSVNMVVNIMCVI